MPRTTNKEVTKEQERLFKRRRDNLRELDKEMGRDQLCATLGVTTGRISHLISPTAPRGDVLHEEKAREWERKLGRASGWFDKDHSAAKRTTGEKTENGTVLAGAFGKLYLFFISEKVKPPPGALDSAMAVIARYPTDEELIELVAQVILACVK